MNLINKNSSGINLKRLPQLPLEIPAIRHGYLPDANKFPCIVNFSHILRWMHTNWPMAKMDVRRLEEFLYMITMNKYDPSYVKKHIFDNYMRKPAACSAVWKDGIVGRNFDWYYDRALTFMIRVPSSTKRYGSIGVAKGNTLTSEAVSTGDWIDDYKALPYLTMDGVNEKGVYANLNVVNADDTEQEKWRGKKLFAEQAIREILDTCATAQEAAEMVESDVFMPLNFHNYAFHFLICDEERAFVVEDGVAKEETNGHPIITNMRGQNDVFTDGKVDPLKLVEVDKYGAGVERYNKILDRYSELTSIDAMIQMMHDISYSKAYIDSANWLSEMCADYRPMGYDLDLSVDKTVTDPEAFNPVVEIMQKMYQHRTRDDGSTWQTVHSSVYDLHKRELYLTVQEGQTVRRFSLDPFVYN